MKSTIYKKHGKKGLFDEQKSIEHLNEMGNPLEKISSVIDFEFFRSLLESKLLNTDKKNNAENLKNVFIESVEDYLETCKALEKSPGVNPIKATF